MTGYSYLVICFVHSSLSRFQARDKKVPRTFLFPKIIKDGDGEVAFVLAFVPPAFDGFLGLARDASSF